MHPFVEESRMNYHLSFNEVTLGVDTHLDIHMGVLISGTDQRLGMLSVATNAVGYNKLLAWAGKLRCAGVEDTGTYGAGLVQVLQDHAVKVYEVNRPDRSQRRLQGKSDPLDQRAVQLSLTPEGQELYKTIRKSLITEEASMIDDIPP